MLFDGVHAPRLVVQLAVVGSTTSDPNAGSFILGTSRLGTGALGSIAWVSLEQQDLVQSVSIDPGTAGQLDSVAPTTATVTVENWSGFWDPLNTSSPYYPAIDVGAPFRIQAVMTAAGSAALVPGTTVAPGAGVLPGAGSAGTDQSYGLFRGYVDDIVPDYGMTPTVTFSCSDQLAVLGRVKVPEIAPSFDGDTSGQRIARILDEAQIPTSLRALDLGLARMAADGYGDWALALVERVVNSEFGELWVDGDGVIRFYDRTRVYVAPRSTSVQALFSDSGSDIDMSGLAGSRRRAELFNTASVTRSADGAVEQVAQDDTSVARYGIQSFTGQAGQMLQTDADAASLARWIVARFKAPTTKFSELQLEAGPQGMWPVLLPLRRFDRIRVVRDYGPSTVDVQLLVEAVSHTISPDSWQVGLTTRNADSFQPFVLGTSKLGTGVLA